MQSLSTLAVAITVVLAARGIAAQCCGDCSGDGQVTVDEIIIGVNRALEGCVDDDLCSIGRCCRNLARCETDLAECIDCCSGARRFPASGQTTEYGPGSDGAVQAGAPLSYTDNGDGTITDNNTGLMWEKKDDSGGIHDKDNRFSWGMVSSPYAMNGTMMTQFLASLNTPPCFAGHCDWRIPNMRELQSIIDYEVPRLSPSVNAAFHRAATCTGCTDVRLASCSCTSGAYWSSTTSADDPGVAHSVSFGSGIQVFGKDGRNHVRGVRGNF